MVGIDVFSTLDIRVGRIVEIQDHEQARKPMYKLTIDFGGEIGRRNIVAGIKASYTKEELQDKKIVCIVNLDPKTIAGAESHGMLLAAGENADAISILIPDRDIEIGSRIH